jgi:hypothetical protein
MNGSELLVSWSQSDAKSAVLEFVESVSRPGASYAPPGDRIATFDSDGTLGAGSARTHRPTSSSAAGTRWPRPTRPRQKEQPYKALAENDRAWLWNLHAHVPDLARPEGPHGTRLA